jgi:hypothetical protein
MAQMNLFPPPGAPTQPLPPEVQMQIRQLLAELLVVVLATTPEKPTSREGNNHE